MKDVARASVKGLSPEKGKTNKRIQIVGAAIRFNKLKGSKAPKGNQGSKGYYGPN